MDKALQQLLAFVNALSFRQRVILGGSILLVGGTVWLFTHLMGVIIRLCIRYGAGGCAKRGAKTSGTEYYVQISPDGTAILVKSDDWIKRGWKWRRKDQFRAGEWDLSCSTSQLVGSDFSEKVNYQRRLRRT